MLTGGEEALDFRAARGICVTQRSLAERLEIKNRNPADAA